VLVEAIDDRWLAPAAGPEERGLGSAELADALAELTEREREVLALRFGGDLTGAEIAHVLGLSLANVQQITSRALRKLRTLLGHTRGQVVA
jgi:RNA polymerase sigma factor (sigma-70 family)